MDKSIKLNKDDLIDPVSYKNFDISDPPCTLPCGHSFAKSTLENLKNMKSYKCPTCKVAFPSTLQIQKNQLLVHALENIKSYQPCKDHPEKAGKFACMEEKQFFCEICLCSDKHSGHEKMPVEDLMEKVTKSKVKLAETVKMV
mmetsp:Transcript_31196/g.28379  ORF Transcript_31196/g.28379 Transcript_31196/m.28379 type:complete len:143 (+) Transcript_31196:84-512(+)